MDGAVIVALISGGFSFAGGVFGVVSATRVKLGVLQQGQDQLSRNQETLRVEMREGFQKINGRCERHSGILSEHGERLAGLEAKPK